MFTVEIYSDCDIPLQNTEPILGFMKKFRRFLESYSRQGTLAITPENILTKSIPDQILFCFCSKKEESNNNDQILAILELTLLRHLNLGVIRFSTLSEYDRDSDSSKYSQKFEMFDLLLKALRIGISNNRNPAFSTITRVELYTRPLIDGRRNQIEILLYALFESGLVNKSYLDTDLFKELTSETIQIPVNFISSSNIGIGGYLLVESGKNFKVEPMQHMYSQQTIIV